MQYTTDTLRQTKTILILLVFCLCILWSCKQGRHDKDTSKAGNFKELPWYKKPMRIAALQCNFEKDNLAVIDKWEEMGFNVEQLFHPMGDSYSAIYDPAKHSKILKDYVKKAHEKGFKIILYLNVHVLGPTLEHNKDIWSQRTKDGSLFMMYDTYPSICFNSSWKDYFFTILDSLKNIDVDGLFLDGPVINPNVGCYCDYCKKKYSAEYGGTLGEDKDKLWKFNERTFDGFLEEAYNYWKKNNPDKIFYQNFAVFNSKQLFTDIEKTLCFNDILGSEGGFQFYEPAKNAFIWKPSYTAKVLEAIAPDKPRVIFMDGTYKPWNWWLHTQAETQLCIASVTSNGANIWYCFCSSMKYALHAPGSKAASEILHFLKNNEDIYTNTHSVADVALFFSFVNNRFYGASGEESDFTGKSKSGSKITSDDTENAMKGYYSMLTESQIPFDMITDMQLTSDKLAKYKVIVIPSVCAMDDNTYNAFREYVKKGGTVITEFGVSLYDSKGNEKDNFGLADVFGVSKVVTDTTTTILHHNNYNYFTLDTVMPFYTAVNLMLVPLPAASVKIKANAGTEVYARALGDLKGRYTPLKGQTDDFFTHNNYGNGNAFYFAGSMGAMYNRYHITEYRKLLAAIVRAHTGGHIQFVNAPTNLEIVMREQGKQKILYLVNYQAGPTRPFEYITPVRDLKIIVPDSYAITSATSRKTNEKLHIDKAKHEITLPELQVYDAIVME